MKTKPLTILTLLLLSMHCCIAQDSLKFLIGMQVSPTYHIVNTPAIKNYEYRPQAGFSVGFAWQYNFSKRFALHTEFNYEEIGYTRRQIDIMYGFNPYPHLTTFRSSILTIPLTMKFNVISKSKTKLFINTGVVGGYVLNDQIAAQTNGDSWNYKKSYAPDDRPYPYWGCIAGVGMEQRITQRLQLSIEARDCLVKDELDGWAPDHSLRLLLGVYYNL